VRDVLLLHLLESSEQIPRLIRIGHCPERSSSEMMAY
jgi:hypothetical protein